MAERFHYRRVDDFLISTSSAELTDLFAYLHVDDQVQEERITRAILKAFSGSQPTQKAREVDDEEVIDTTKPEFAKNFKGFINNPQPRNMPVQRPMQSAQIIMG